MYKIFLPSQPIHIGCFEPQVEKYADRSDSGAKKVHLKKILIYTPTLKQKRFYDEN